MELRDDETTVHEIGRRTYVVAPVEPLDVDGVRTIEVGVGLWTLVTLAMLPFVGRLRSEGRGWWIWCCLAGVGLGLIGLEYARRRKKQRTAAQNVSSSSETVSR